MLLRRIYICFFVFFQVRMYFICKFVQRYCWGFFIFVGIVNELLHVSKQNFTFERVVLALLTLVYAAKLYFLSIFFSYIDFTFQNFFCKLTWTSKLYDYLLVDLLWNTTRAPPAITYQDFCSNITWTSRCMFFNLLLLALSCSTSLAHHFLS